MTGDWEEEDRQSLSKPRWEEECAARISVAEKLRRQLPFTPGARPTESRRSTEVPIHPGRRTIQDPTLFVHRKRRMDAMLAVHGVVALSFNINIRFQ
jgi:hypothetical protein